MSGEVVENFGTGIIGPIFVFCRIEEWSVRIKIIPYINTMYFRIRSEINIYYL